MVPAVQLMAFGGVVAAVFTYFVVRRTIFLHQELHAAVEFLKKEPRSAVVSTPELEEVAHEHFRSTFAIYSALAAVGWVIFTIGAIRYHI